MQTTDPLLLLLDNWARWCDVNNSCGPAGYQSPPWENMSLPYKCLITEDEALDEMDSRAEAHDPSGILVESWVVQLPDPPKTAIQVHYVHMPEHKRHEFNLTFDQWQERRAWVVGKRLKRHIRLPDYEREVGEGMAILRDCLTTWKAGEA